MPEYNEYWLFPMLARSRKRLFFVLPLAFFASAGYAGEITVSAAASLTNAFREVAQRYEAQHVDRKVLLNFGGSGALLQQIAKGAPVDVFASADQETMDKAQQQGLVAATERHNFASNALVVVVPADSTLPLKALTDLKKTSVQRIAIGNPASVPVGRYTMLALKKAGLQNALREKTINTQNVRQSLDYVTRGEVDAGFVYATDAGIAADKIRIAFTVPLNTTILYPIALTRSSTNPDEARAFVQYVLSPEGQTILARFGFLKP